MNRREYLLNSPSLGQHQPIPDRGIRYLKVALGGGFEKACLGMLEDAEYAAAEQLAAIVFIDTDANNLEDLPDHIKLILSDVRAADLLEAIEEYRERFPGWEILGNLEEKWRALGAAESLPSGLMTRRELGVLVLLYALWRKPSLVRNFLLNGARGLHTIDAPGCWKLNGTALKKHRLVISYFFSSCGGTGSSLALLIRDLQHYLLSTDSGFAATAFIAHILVPGPMLHSAHDPQALKANTWAFFLELMQRYREKLDSMQMAEYSVPRKHRPFQQVYLYDEQNSEELIFGSRDRINEVVREIEKLMMLGKEGQEYEARLVDHHGHFPNMFSSAGCWKLVYPYTQIERAFSLQSGAQWITDRPLKPLDDRELARITHDELSDFLNRHPGLRDLPEFGRDGDNRRLGIDFGQIRNHSRKQLPAVAEDLSRRQLEEHAETLRGLVTQYQQRLTAVVTAQVETLLDRPGGLEITQRFLHALFGLLTEHKQSLDKELERVRTERRRRQAQGSDVQAANSLRRFGLNRREAYLKRTQRAKEEQLAELRSQAQLELVEQQIKVIQRLRDASRAWTEGLTKLHGTLQDELDAHWRNAEKMRPIIEQWVVCEEEIAEMYSETAPDVMERAGGGIRFRWQADGDRFTLHYEAAEPATATRWNIVSETGIERHVSHFRRYWAGLADRSVEEILEERGESPEEILAYLTHMSAPLLKVDDTIQIPAEKSLRILSSETESFWGKLPRQSGLSMVATGNRHRICLLNTIHGINPLTGLMQSKAWRQAYEDVVASGRSPHVFPDVEIDLDTAIGQPKSSESKEETDESSEE